jgi:tetratricopeptide (TPR) repeat protein
VEPPKPAAPEGGKKIGAAEEDAPQAAKPPRQVSGAARDSFLAGVGKSQAGDFDGAIGDFDAAWSRDDGLVWALYNAGVAAERLGDPGRARSYYVKALKAQPDFDPASENLTRVRLRLGAFQEAENDLRQRIAQYPANLGLRNQLVEVLIATGRFESAEQESRKILKSDEHSIPAMLNLASVYYAKKRYELSKMVLTNASLVDKQNPIIWNKLAFVELALGNKPQALEDMKTAASLRQDYPEAHVNYGQMLNDAEDFATAQKELELAVKYAPDNAFAHLNLGSAYRGLKMFDKAQAEYERALVLNGKLIEAYFNLGVLYLDGDKPGLDALKRLDQSMQYFDKYTSNGGQDGKLAQYRKDAQQLIEKEHKRLQREEKDKLRKAADAKKKEDEAKKQQEALAKKSEEDRLKAEQEAAKKAAADKAKVEAAEKAKKAEEDRQAALSAEKARKDEAARSAAEKAKKAEEDRQAALSAEKARKDEAARAAAAEKARKDEEARRKATPPPKPAGGKLTDDDAPAPTPAPKITPPPAKPAGSKLGEDDK